MMARLLPVVLAAATVAGCADAARGPDALSTESAVTGEGLEADDAQRSQDTVGSESRGAGRLGLGEHCEKNSECQTGLVCRQPSDCEDNFFDTGLWTECAAPSPVWGCCNEDADCLPGLVCSWPDLPCFSVCQVPEGGECDPAGFPYVDDGDECAEDAYALVCFPREKGGGGTCLNAGPEGYLCDEESEFFYCAKGLACEDGVCSAVGVEGHPCEGEYDCLPGLVCNTGYVPPQCMSGAEDQNCVVSAECAAPLICSNSTSPGQCKPPQGQGVGCKHKEECAGQLICHYAFSPSQCQPASDWGEPCSVSEDCVLGLYCDTAADPPQCWPED